MRTWEMFVGDRVHDGLYLTVGDHPLYIEAHGEEPARAVVTEDPEGPYYGWIRTPDEYSVSRSKTPVMIQPRKVLFDVQFPYGPEIEAEHGRGKIVRLRVEAV